MYALAVVPALVLFLIVWRYDTVEKEPVSLLLKLVFCGALTIVSAVLIGLFGDWIMHFCVDDRSSLIYIIIDSFIFTALVEEGGKFLVLKMITWKNKEFNYTFDGVVYAVCVALGFTVIENVIYIFRNSGDNVILRVILMIVGHALFAVFMGYYYGLARYAKGAGKKKTSALHLAEAVVVPILMHGFYVFCLRTEKTVFLIIFAVYEILITVVTVRQFLKLSKNDTLIPGMEYTVSKDGDGKKGGAADESKM